MGVGGEELQITLHTNPYNSNIIFWSTLFDQNALKEVFVFEKKDAHDLPLKLFFHRHFRC